MTTFPDLVPIGAMRIPIAVRIGRVLSVLGLVFAVTANADGNPDLDHAAKAYEELNYAECLKAADMALRRPANSREQVLRSLELRAFAAAALGKKAPAQAAFRDLLSLDPERRLPSDASPKVATPFLEARAWIESRGRLTATLDAASPAKDGFVEVTLSVKSDPRSLVRGIRVHARGLGGEFASQTVPVKTGAVQRVTVENKQLKKGEAVEVYAEVLGTFEGVLLSVGDPSAPRRFGADAPPPAPTEAFESAPVPAPPPLAAVPDASAPVVVSPPSTPETAKAAVASEEGIRPTRIVGGVVAGLGIVSAGTGAYFGLSAMSLRNQVQSATKDSQGRIVSMTQAVAYQKAAQADQDATVANVLLIAGTAVAIAGVVIFILPASSPVTASIAPGPGQISVAGRF